ncbi:MAG: hypothetical protein JWL87_643 [Candidatus Adlerbacteria bacterium]|nr:hypothetical protein [Candidatus Adlerbacteria bacterium]
MRQPDDPGVNKVISRNVPARREYGNFAPLLFAVLVALAASLAAFQYVTGINVGFKF